jgi:MFS family permease
VPVGRLVDRYGARLLLTLGSAVAGLTLVGLSAVRALWQFYALWSGGLGLAAALTLYPVTFTVVAKWFERRRGAALALLTLLGGLASPIFIPLAGALLPHLGWRGTVLALGGVQLGVALPLHALVVRRHPEDLGVGPDGAAVPYAGSTGPLPGMPLRAALRTVAFWTLTVAIALTQVAAAIVMVHQVAYLIGRGYNAVLAAGVAGLVGLASLPGRYILNTLSDRVGPQGLLGLCLGSEAVGVVLLLSERSPAWLAAYVVVYGAAFGAVSPLRAAVMAAHVGRRAYGAITALQGVPVALGAAGGPLIAGWLYDRSGSYTIPFWLSAGAYLLAAVGVILAPPPERDALDV